MFENGDKRLHYIERYQEGHCREVWNELMQMGSEVFEDWLYTEALAVARAMVQRIRTNIETLVARLLQLGFVFGYDVRLQRQLGFSLTSASERETYREWKQWAYEQPLVFLPAKQREEERAERQQWRKQDPSNPFFFEEDDEESSSLQRKSFVDELRSIIEPLPLILQAWFEEIEAVNFYGYYAPWDELLLSLDKKPFPEPKVSSPYLMSSCDPFQVGTLNEQEMFHLKEEYKANKLCRLEFAPDRYFKDFYGGTSTPYGFDLPQTSADVVMSNPFGSGSMTFVEYIRVSLTWAGFPGMAKWPEVPRDDLNALTRDLLPF